MSESGKKIDSTQQNQRLTPYPHPTPQPDNSPPPSPTRQERGKFTTPRNQPTHSLPTHPAATRQPPHSPSPNSRNEVKKNYSTQKSTPSRLNPHPCRCLKKRSKLILETPAGKRAQKELPKKSEGASTFQPNFNNYIYFVF